jgi:hypothetical protein
MPTAKLSQPSVPVRTNDAVFVEEMNSDFENVNETNYKLAGSQEKWSN